MNDIHESLNSEYFEKCVKLYFDSSFVTPDTVDHLTRRNIVFLWHLSQFVFIMCVFVCVCFFSARLNSFKFKQYLLDLNSSHMAGMLKTYTSTILSASNVPKAKQIMDYLYMVLIYSQIIQMTYSLIYRAFLLALFMIRIH